MTTPTPANLTVLEASIAAAQDSADTIARAITANDDYTEEGKNERYARHTAEHRAHLEKLTATVEKITAAAQEHQAKIYGQIMPTPTDDTATVATELQAARILARPGMTDHETATAWLRDTPPSATRTAVAEEMQARGIITQEALDATLMAMHPEYIEAQRGVVAAQTVVTNVFRPRLAALSRRLDHRQAAGPEVTEQHRASIVPNLPSLNIGDIPTWTPTNAESAYRSR